MQLMRKEMWFFQGLWIEAALEESGLSCLLENLSSLPQVFTGKHSFEAEMDIDVRQGGLL